MQTLDVLLAPLLSRVNRNLAEITPAGALLEELEGRSFAVRIERSALAIALSVTNGTLETSTDIPEEPDVVIEGPLSGLLQMATADGDMAALAGSGVSVAGRADLAQSFQRLLKLAKPDPEEELAGVIGDAAAFGVSKTLRRVRDWGRQSQRIMAANVREYLQEERREVPSRHAMTRFTRDVQTLRDDVERAEARLRKLETTRK
ncbi:MAG: SCP2 sterol-binding domain-containing protein [Pseudomonadota bacterium]